MTTSTNTAQKEKRGNIVFKVALLLCVAAAFTTLQFFFDATQYLSPDVLRARLIATGIWAPLVYTSAMALLVVTPLPTLPLNIAAGALFGPVFGTLYSVAGATLGALISFSLARFLGRDVLERYLKGHVNFCTSCSDRLLVKLVLLGRLIPVLSFDLISYGAGLTTMSVKNYLIANFIGMLPLTFLYNYFGSMVTVSLGVSIVLGLLFTALFFILPFWIERYDLFSLRKLFPQNHPDETGSQDKNEMK